MIKRALNRLVLAFEYAVLTAWYARYAVLILITAVWIIAFFVAGCRTPGMACIGALLLIPIGYYLLIRGTNYDKNR